MNPEKQENNRNADGTFKEGMSGNPNGRPKGKTMKEFAREWLLSMSDDEKREWLGKQSNDFIWRMAEGNPKQDTDITTDGEKINGVIILPQKNADTLETPA